MNSAAIVCKEIAADKAPILRATRTHPADIADSGWQFLCGRFDDDPANAQVWSLGEVVDYDPTILPFLELPFGSVIERDSREGEWVIGNDVGEDSTESRGAS